MNIWDTYGQWDAIANGDNVREIQIKITGEGVRWKPNYVSPEVDYVFRTTDTLAGGATAIDFGCGLGRNGGMLKSRFARVVGYDIPEMIAKYREVYPDGGPYDATYSNMEELVVAEKVNMIYDSVVFQHIVDVDYCRKLLAPLLEQPSLSTCVSIKNHHNRLTSLMEVLAENSWHIYHTATETLSFEQEPHDVLVLRRPDRG